MKIGKLGIVCILLLMICNSVGVVTVYPGVPFFVDNAIYTVADTMNFSQIFADSSWIKFNNTDFNITFPNAT